MIRCPSPQTLLTGGGHGRCLARKVERKFCKGVLHYKNREVKTFRFNFPIGKYARCGYSLKSSSLSPAPASLAGRGGTRFSGS